MSDSSEDANFAGVAIKYAERGWAVFPCNPETKSPLIRDWPHIATTDLEIIATWTKLFPTAMVGIVTGKRSGIVVIDTDLDQTKGLDGDAALLDLGELPDTPTVRTPRGGYHRYFRYDSQRPLRNSAGQLGAGIDIRGDGGYVIAAGSINSHHQKYEWYLPIGLVDIADAPDWIFAKLQKTPALLKSSSDQKPPVPSRYLGAAIDNEVTSLKAAPSGTRNAALNRSAFKLSQLAHGDHSNTTLIEQRLLDAADENGLVGDDGLRAAIQTIRSGLRAGSLSPRGPAVPSNHDGPLLTQSYVAEDFVEKNGTSLRYDHERGRWFEFDGICWREDSLNRVSLRIQHHVDRLTADAKSSEKKALCCHSAITAIDKLCRNQRECSIVSNFWDSDPFLLGTPNGYLQLKDGNLIAPDPSLGVSKTTAVAPSTDADCPTWLEFLRQATGDDQELIHFLQVWCGICLTGSTQEQTLVFIYGPGGNGKSVFVNTVSAIIGDYATTAAMDTFTASRHPAHETELARLRGARLVVANETEEGRAWAEARIKALTGGDKIAARFMRQDHFEFRPQFKLVVVGNHKPILRNVDEAMRRRLLIVPFERKPEKPDPKLEEKLRLEWQGILRWMVNGAVEWQATALPRPAAVLVATREYFAEQDLFGEWLEAKCDTDPKCDLWEYSGALYTSFVEFASAAGEDRVTKKAFSMELRKRGFKPRRISGGCRGFDGVHLKRSENRR
jgi:putative DNA primase/helicase